MQSKAATELAKRIMLSNSGSKATLYQYMYGVYRYCSYVGKTPDDLISECLDPDGNPVGSRVSQHAKDLDHFRYPQRLTMLDADPAFSNVRDRKDYRDFRASLKQ